MESGLMKTKEKKWKESKGTSVPSFYGTKSFDLNYYEEAEEER